MQVSFDVDSRAFSNELAAKFKKLVGKKAAFPIPDAVSMPLMRADFTASAEILIRCLSNFDQLFAQLSNTFRVESVEVDDLKQLIVVVKLDARLHDFLAKNLDAHCIREPNSLTYLTWKPTSPLETQRRFHFVLPSDVTNLIFSHCGSAWPSLDPLQFLVGTHVTFSTFRLSHQKRVVAELINL